MPMGERRRSAVVISGVHDYRGERRVSVHAIAAGLKRRGYDTSFLSIRYSALSLLKRDLRAPLWRKANRREGFDGVQCYLWRTPFHPFATGAALSDRLMTPLHDVYANWPNGEVDAMLRAADVVVIESGLPIVLIPRARRASARSRIIYLGADGLDTIGAHADLQTLLRRHGDKVDHFCVLARGLAPQFGWARQRTFHIPQGVSPSDFASIGPNPYAKPVNAVSVGSMLFDASFFEIATRLFPQVRFHVIGSESDLKPRANLYVYSEMRFAETLPYLAYATIGLAPYRETATAGYIAESSLKLTQYDYLRRPAVCPDFAVGRNPNRFGYRPGDPASIKAAVEAALDHTFAPVAKPLSWDEVVERMLEPRRFSDTALSDEAFGPWSLPTAEVVAR